MLFVDVRVGALLHSGSKASGIPEVVIEDEVSSDGTRRMKPSNTYKPQAWLWLYRKQVVNPLMKCSDE